MPYCTIADIRAAGLTDVVAYPDADITAALILWQQFLDRACRQWFESRPLTLTFDGTDSDTLHFGVPIVSIDYIRLNGDPTDLDPESYRVYAGRSYPDDRRNPRIKLRTIDEFSSIFSTPIHGTRLKFRKGRQNQEISGNFGFIEDDDSTPELIKRALCKLVIEKLVSPIPVPGVTPPPGAPPIIAGALIEEWTDGHKRKYTNNTSVGASRPSPFNGITQDPEILAIIKLYRAPIGIASPAHFSV